MFICEGVQHDGMSDPLQDLDEEERQTLVELAKSEASGRVSRRDVVQGVASMGIGAAVYAGASGTLTETVTAQPDTGDSDGNLGGPSNRYDAWFDGQDVYYLYNDIYAEAVNSLGTVSGTTNIDLTQGNMVTCTLGGDTTFTLSNPVDTTGDSDTSDYTGNALMLKVQQDGSTQYAITWPSGITWVDPGGSPDDPATGAELEVGLQSYDGGTDWYGGEVARY